jgi:hypothetical protein
LSAIYQFGCLASLWAPLEPGGARNADKFVRALLGQPFLSLYFPAEHASCPFSGNMFENARPTFTTRLVRLLAWNMPLPRRTPRASRRAVPQIAGAA